MPRTSNPSKVVLACVQSCPSGENQAAERVVPVPFHSPTITKPPFHDPTARGMYVPADVVAPGSTWGDQERPSVDSQATPFPAATTAPGREATPAIISWPRAESISMGVHVAPLLECQALAITSVGDEPMLLPMTTSPPWPSSEKPWATNRRPPIANASDPDRWLHVDPSSVAQMVVADVTVPLEVELTVPAMSKLWSSVVRYGPKSSLAAGVATALPQPML